MPLSIAQFRVYSVMAQRGKGRARSVLEVGYGGGPGECCIAGRGRRRSGRSGRIRDRRSVAAYRQAAWLAHASASACRRRRRARHGLLDRAQACASGVRRQTASLRCGRSHSSSRRSRSGCCSRGFTVSTTATRSEPITRPSTTLSASFRSSRSERGASSSSRMSRTCRAPNLGRLVVFWLLAVAPHSAPPCREPCDRATAGRVRPERHHRRVGQRCTAARRQDREALRVRPPCRRVRRPRRPRLREQRRRHGCRARRDDATICRDWFASTRFTASQSRSRPTRTTRRSE